MSKKFRAQGMVEWALIVTLMSLACVVALFKLAPNIKNVWFSVSHALDKSECERTGKTWDSTNNTCS